jgi:UDP-2-acetamido-3-amino-2,3-dideoxy-glucuronate N-acetyltransferase
MNELPYFVHPNAIVESENVGTGTRIWAFVQVQKNSIIGKDCNLGNGVFVESGVTIGDRVTIKNGISLWEGLVIEDDVFLGPNAVFTNDMFPRSKMHAGNYLKTLIKKGASIGANATVLCGITLGSYCMIGAGSVVTRSIPDFALVAGNPARFMYWISKNGEKLSFDNSGYASDSLGGKYELRELADTQTRIVVNI